MFSIDFSGKLVATLSGSPEDISAIHATLLAAERQDLRVPLKRVGTNRLQMFRGTLAQLMADRLVAAPLDRPDALAAAKLEEAGLLRPYQAQAVAAAIRAQLLCGIVRAPTGSGKTRIAAGIMAVAGGHWIYSAPNTALVNQAAAEIRKLSSDFMRVTGQHFTVEGRSLGQLRNAEGHGLLCDECHRAAARDWSENVASVFTDYRIGLSATPLKRCDHLNGLVVALTGPVVFSIEVPELQRQGFLAKGKVVRREVHHDD